MDEKSIIEVHKDGAFIEMDDGSVWEIAPVDQAQTRGWMPLQTVQISENESGIYSIKNVDATDQESVSATI